MEMGYNTLDLAMLVIAVIIYAASRVPVRDAPVKKLGSKSRNKQESGDNSYSLK